MIGGGVSDHVRDCVSARQVEVVAKSDDDIGYRARCASALKSKRASVGYRAPMLGGGVSDHVSRVRVGSKSDDDIGYRARCASAFKSKGQPSEQRPWHVPQT
jgi:hypothetical protein